METKLETKYINVKFETVAEAIPELPRRASLNFIKNQEKFDDIKKGLAANEIFGDQNKTKEAGEILKALKEIAEEDSVVPFKNFQDFTRQMKKKGIDDDAIKSLEKCCSNFNEICKIEQDFAEKMGIPTKKNLDGNEEENEEEEVLIKIPQEKEKKVESKIPVVEDRNCDEAAIKYIKDLYEEKEKEYLEERRPDNLFEIEKEWAKTLSSLMSLYENIANKKFNEERTKLFEKQKAEYDKLLGSAKEAAQAGNKNEVNNKCEDTKRLDEEYKKYYKELLEKATLSFKKFGDECQKLKLKNISRAILISAGADMPIIQPESSTDNTTIFETPKLTPEETKKLIELQHEMNGVLSLVAFAFAKSKEGWKAKITCDVKNGFQIIVDGKAEKLSLEYLEKLPNKGGNSDQVKTENLHFLQMCELSRIFTAAGMKNVISKKEDEKFEYTNENNEKCEIKSDEFYKIIEDTMEKMLPKQSYKINDFNMLIGVVNKDSKGNFESYRLKSFEKVFGATSLITNEVRQIPDGVVEKRITSDGSPILPGYGSHGMHNTKENKNVIITNWINSDIEATIRENDKKAEVIKAEDIKKYPFSLTLKNIESENNKKDGSDIYVISNEKIKKLNDLGDEKTIYEDKVIKANVFEVNDEKIDISDNKQIHEKAKLNLGTENIEEENIVKEEYILPKILNPESTFKTSAEDSKTFSVQPNESKEKIEENIEKQKEERGSYVERIVDTSKYNDIINIKEL